MADTANKRVINVNVILHQLTQEGKTRSEIKEEYGLTHAEAKMLFTHPKLKGVKSKKLPNILIIDEPIAGDESNQFSESPNPSENVTSLYGQGIN